MRGFNEKLVRVDELVDASTCRGKLEVVVTLDELHRAYTFGYNNGVSGEFDESAPVTVSKFKYEVPDVNAQKW